MTRRSWMAGLLLLTLSLGLSGLLVEGVLRVYAGVGDSALAQALRWDPYDVLIEPHGTVGYRPKPGAEFQYPETGAVSHMNASSYRGPEVAVPKPDSVTRVVIIGGSTTHGWAVADDETIDRYMRDQLEARYPERRFEVVNLGFDGYDSWQIYERLLGDGLRLDPDYVIVNTGVNDVRNARHAELAEERDERTLLWLPEIRRMRMEAEQGGPSLGTRLKHWFFLARLPGALRAMTSVRREGEPVEPQRDAMDYFEANLRRIVDEIGGSTRVILFSTEPSSLPTKYEPDATSHRTYWIRDARTTQRYRDSLRSRLERVAAEAVARGERVGQVPYLELPPDVFLDDAHLTAEGNRRLARHFVAALAPYLERGGALAQPED